jgi:hypothetical protein
MMSPNWLAGPGPASPHAFGFQLEDANRVASLEQLVNRRVIPLQRGEIDLDPALLEQQLPFLQH